MDKPTTDPQSAPEAPAAATGSNLQDELATRFRPFLSMFGSVAAVSAFLLFAGFLSDFGAYRIAGLPRLNFSITGLVESGSDVAVDMLSLLAQGTRAFWLVVLIGAVVGVWTLHRSRFLKPWAHSRRLYRLVRLALLALTFIVFASIVDRTQRSLSGEMHTAAAVERGLREAYKGGFPDPYERQRAIDRQGYELRFYRLPNWAVHAEAGWRWLKTTLPLIDPDRLDDSEAGIVLRGLPESRRDARHVFGWLALTLLALVLAAVLCQWWREGLDRSSPILVAGPASPDKPNGDMDPAIDRLIAPLTILLLAIAALLLPLAHGVLAKKALGGEHVMVYLKAPNSPSTEEVAPGKDGKEETTKRAYPLLHPEPTKLAWPAGRFDCSGDFSEVLRDPLSTHNEALRDLVQVRKSETRKHAEAFKAYLDKLDEVAAAVVEMNCAEAVRQFWAIKPPPGLAAQAPEIAETYRRAATRVATAYGLRIGTILTYPRDTQPLTLVDSIVPRNVNQSPAWSLQAIEAPLVAESVVLPDLFRRGMQRVGDILRVDPDNAAINELLVAPSSEALEVVLPLLTESKLFANGRGVSVTAIGGMAWVSAAEKPQLSRDAIRLLADLTSSVDTAFWPGKDEDIRGTAVTALQLSRSPYAGHLLGQQVAAAGPESCAKTAKGAMPSIACVPQTATAAGYLLQDLANEAHRFSTADPVPKALQVAREALEAFIGQLVTTDAVAEDVRGAACTAIGVGGGITITDTKQSDIYLQRLALGRLGDYPFSAGACLLHANRVGLNPAKLRPVLRSVALATQIPGYSAGEVKRMRFAAFSALTDMGISGELDVVSRLYLQEPADSFMRKAAQEQLSEVSERPIAQFLRGCANSAERPELERARCLEGFAHAKYNVDGDDGTASDVIALARAGPEVVAAAACGAIGVFNKRRGRIVMRLESAGDPTVVGCLTRLEAKANPKPDADKQLQRLLHPGADAKAATAQPD